MKAVKDSGLPVARTMRLMVETTEETGGDAMNYYQKQTPLPAYNIVLDSWYPAVVAEKGVGALRLSFARGEVGTPADRATVTIGRMSGAASATTIAQTATATLLSMDADALARRLTDASARFIDRYKGQGGPFQLGIGYEGRDGGAVTVRVTGTSAHGSRPDEGVNPLPRLTLFLQEAAGPLAPNGYAQAVKAINDLFGLDYLGKAMGLAYADDFMGPLTVSPTVVTEADGKVFVVANVRMPRGRSPGELTTATEAKVAAWANAQKIQAEVAHRQGNWMARDPGGPWLATLLNIFGDTTGLPAQPVSSAGSTTAKQMPNAINFGPAMPGKKYTGHNAKEFKEVVDLEADLQMFTEMLVRIGNLDRMQ